MDESNISFYLNCYLCTFKIQKYLFGYNLQVRVANTLLFKNIDCGAIFLQNYLQLC